MSALLATAAALAVLPGCGGCGKKNEYPSTLTFPPRADRLVLKLPDKPAPALNDPFKREQEIAALDALGGKTLDPAAVSEADRAALNALVKETFGTPAAPTLAGGGDVAKRLKLSDAHLVEGGKLFLRHCLQCHNHTGDGRGTSGATIPFPRDYRQGQFKFTTGNDSGKPRRADLLRTLADGLKGTPMPSFGLLQEGERDLLAGYVVYLAVRGQFEFEAFRGLAEGKHIGADDTLKAILAEWEKAEATPPLPAEPPGEEPGSPAHADAVRRGFARFTEKADNACVSCHGEFGRKPVLRYDVWGTVAKPADLTQNNVFKGGGRPEDVYARVRFGIPAVGMPAHPKLTDREVWDVVRFVRAVPYRVQLPDDVRNVVYPP